MSICILFSLVFLTAYFCLFRNCLVHHVRISFICDVNLYPEKYDALPSYEGMIFGLNHQFRFTKKQWIKWVNKKLEAA